MQSDFPIKGLLQTNHLTLSAMRPPLLTIKDFFVGFLITSFVSTVLMTVVVRQLHLDLDTTSTIILFGTVSVGNFVWIGTFLYLVKRRLEKGV